MRANETYLEAKCQFSVRHSDVLLNSQCPHKWWSTLKSAVFRLSSSLPPLVGGGGGLVCESFREDDLLSDHFDRKQSRESVAPPLSCHPSPRLPSLPSGLVKSRVYCLTWTVMGHPPTGYVSSFS